MINTGKTFVARDIAEGMMKQVVTIIDPRPAPNGVKSIIVDAEMKRRGVRFLPRQALKRIYRSVSNGGALNPFEFLGVINAGHGIAISPMGHVPAGFERLQRIGKRKEHHP